jgi:AraC-like DNA-binding protein
MNTIHAKNNFIIEIQCWVHKGKKGMMIENGRFKRNITSLFLLFITGICQSVGNFSNRNSVIAWMSKLYVKNMVCDRCKAAVKKILDDFSFYYTSITLGEVEMRTEPTSTQLNQLKEALEMQGFEIIETRSARIVNQIKKNILDLARGEKTIKIKLSTFLAEELHKDYASLSNLFSQIEGITIEQYFILQKVEFAKELLVYDEFSIAQIAERLGYSSAAHLSSQFKKVTGLTPMHFKKIGTEKRVSLDKV